MDSFEKESQRIQMENSLRFGGSISNIDVEEGDSSNTILTCLKSMDLLKTQIRKQSSKINGNLFGPKLRLSSFSIPQNSIISYDNMEMNLESEDLKQMVNLSLSPSRERRKETNSKINENEMNSSNNSQNQKDQFSTLRQPKPTAFLPTRASRNIIETSGTAHTEATNINRIRCFSCNSNKSQQKHKKRNKHDNSYFSTVNNTRRSGNLSIKSLKLNDSLNKLRKKRSGVSSHRGDDYQSTQDISRSKNNQCRCVIF
jgi:hypothetical protein